MCSENWSRLGLGGPGFHGKPGPAPELWPGRPVPTETFELVPVVAGTLVPVEATRLVPVSRGSQDMSLGRGLGTGPGCGFPYDREVATPTQMHRLC